MSGRQCVFILVDLIRREESSLDCVLDHYVESQIGDKKS